MSNAWWNKKWGKDAVCPITLKRLRSGLNNKGSTYTIKLRCSHRFDRKALITWVHKNSSTCPCCRTVIYISDIM